MLQAASSGKYLDLCLAMLTRHFETPSNFLEKLKLPYGLTKKDQVLTRVHSALKDIADLVPLSPARIVTIVSDRLELYRKMKGTVSSRHSSSSTRMLLTQKVFIVGLLMIHKYDMDLPNKKCEMGFQIGHDLLGQCFLIYFFVNVFWL